MQGFASAAVGRLLGLVLIVGTVAGAWTIFEKAGWPGWVSIVPTYNVMVLLKISNRHGGSCCFSPQW